MTASTGTCGECLHPPLRMNDLQALRQHLKRVRLSLSDRAQAFASASIAGQIQKLPRFRRAKTLAGYFGSAGEIDPMPLMKQAAALGKHCYLPVLHPFLHGRLLFCRWQPGDELVRNRYEIPEPHIHADRLIAARNLDLVIVPLLGFDSDCNRIGMGGGYYDRSFAFTRRFRHIKGPYLLGLAHESQRVERLEAQPWDVAPDAVITEQNLYLRQWRA